MPATFPNSAPIRPVAHAPQPGTSQKPAGIRRRINVLPPIAAFFPQNQYLPGAIAKINNLAPNRKINHPIESMFCGHLSDHALTSRNPAPIPNCASSGAEIAFYRPPTSGTSSSVMLATAPSRKPNRTARDGVAAHLASRSPCAGTAPATTCPQRPSAVSTATV